MISEFPPTATMAVFGLYAICNPPCEPSDRLSANACRQRSDCLRETFQRRAGDAGADLPDAGLLVRNAGVDDRRYPGVEHLARVDPRGRPIEVDRRQRERVVAPERDVR